jgi:hypothetical protein
MYERIVIAVRIRTIHDFSFNDQFRGFSASSGESQPTIFETSIPVSSLAPFNSGCRSSIDALLAVDIFALLSQSEGGVEKK